MQEIQEMRINKYIASCGVCSRREADRYIQEGRVMIDGVLATTGSKVKSNQNVTVNGETIVLETEHKVYALYKPIGYISSMSDEQGQGIKGFLPSGLRLFPVGRLDKDSEGLMLLTNDGDLMNGILKASNGHEKEYLVQVDKSVDPYFIKDITTGVLITHGSTGFKVKTAPCKATRINHEFFTITLIQGMNRQIRRMCGELEYKVLSLKRIRIMNIELGDMKPGECKEIVGKQLEELQNIVKGI